MSIEIPLGVAFMPDSTFHVTEMALSPTNHVSDVFRRGFLDALAGRGEMDPAIYSVEGFCGRKFRLLLNNIVRDFGGEARYLEVGIFKGATLCPVISNNQVTVTGVDNWSWDKDNTCASTFYRSLAKFKNHQTKVSIIENDFQEISATALGKYNIYFYDGNHDEKAQYDGITWAMPALDDVSIVLVDDWNWLNVRKGTMNALRDVDATIHYMIELRTSLDDKIPEHAGGHTEWHNGFFGAVISKAAAV